MKWIAIAYPLSFAMGFAVAQPGFAANSVVIKNAGATAVQIGFDRGATQTIAPRATATFSLIAGQHTTQCHFEGAFDGCNIEEQFTLGEGQRAPLDLLPIYTLQHAVTLAQQGTLRVETRRDTVWATKAQDVAGSATDCANYEGGKLAGISTRIRSGMTVDELALATQQLCGEARPVVATMIGGQKMYVQPNFLIFRDRNGRPILVRQ
jgi:hypothetical protein